jgi:NAD(P)-binding Rossmann-like domain
MAPTSITETPIDAAPKFVDVRWEELLAQMEVPGHPRVYVLGCHANHVTFYSQQVRALNLLDALRKSGTLAQNGHVSIIGAGLAGLTAAAGALSMGLHVHLFEERNDPAESRGRMPLQINSNQRHIDAKIYDWPFLGEESLASLHASVPLLDWNAGSADEVRKMVIEKFEEIAQTSRRIHFHKRRILAADIKRQGSRPSILDLTPPLDALILAIGFGVEDEAHMKLRYWTDDDLGGDQAEGKSYLVTGAGDGGVTDVMRLCFAEFKHRTVLDAFRKAEHLARDVMAAERKSGADRARALLEVAAHINAPLARRNTEVYFTGSPERVFNDRASLLNRLILAWLFLTKRFHFIDAAIGTPVREEAGKAYADFKDWETGDLLPKPVLYQYAPSPEFWSRTSAAPTSFDRILVRHGPGVVHLNQDRIERFRPLRVDFPTFWEASKAQHAMWQARPHVEDWTRVPLWGDAWESVPAADGTSLLDPDFREGVSCVVVGGAVVHAAARTAMTDHLRNRGERAPRCSPFPFLIDPIASFSTRHHFAQTVRSIAAAEVAIFDVTVQSPEVMLLLGIRAVARQSVTILTTKYRGLDAEPDPVDAPFAVPQLPFLLSECRVIGWLKEERLQERLLRVIGEGRTRARTLGARYRDLPVYDEVRELGPEPQDVRPREPSDMVLLLTSFEETYRNNEGAWVRARLGAVATGKKTWIAETNSPELVSRQIYGAIRRTDLCMIDWSYWKANVFFEFGVRLAVNEIPPICVLSKTAPGVKEHAGLRRLFDPIVYDREAPDSSDFEEKLIKRALAFGIATPENPVAETKEPESPSTDRISDSFVYRLVSRACCAAFNTQLDTVWADLRREAAVLIGPDEEQFELPVLYGELSEIGEAAREAAADRLIAAWCYLHYACGIADSLAAGRRDWTNEIFDAWSGLAQRLERILDNRTGDRHQRVLSDIAKARKKLEEMI